MKYQPPANGLHQRRFPNGNLHTEYTIKNGKMHGISRRWHENGQLAEEQRYQNGLRHGVARQWDVEGKLIEKCSFKHGTGHLRQWDYGGHTYAEIHYLRGEITGRMRTFDKDGMLYGQQYFLSNQPISKKKYLEAAARNPELPRFEDEKLTNTLGNYARRLRQAKRQEAKLGPTPEKIQDQRQFDQDCEVKTKESTSKELTSWLTKKAKGQRELGELSRGKASTLARKLYAFGAVKVWAVNIERDDDSDQYSRKLIIKLPETQLEQGKIYELCADLARPFSDGSAPAIRTGRNYMSISLL